MKHTHIMNQNKRMKHISTLPTIKLFLIQKKKKSFLTFSFLAMTSTFNMKTI